MNVSIAAILKAVKDSQLLNDTRFSRFKSLFDNHLPILSLSSDDYTQDNSNGERLFSVYTPWQSYRKDYLDR